MPGLASMSPKVCAVVGMMKYQGLKIVERCGIRGTLYVIDEWSD